MRLAFVSIGAAALVAACNPFSRSGTLTASWTTHADTAEVTMPVTATWCVGPSRLDIRAAAGDTGLGLTIYPSDSGALAGGYTIVEPRGRVTVRPSAMVALRWISKIQIQGWWGDSGAVTLAGGRVRGLSGEGQAWLTSGLGPDSVAALEFAFRGVRVRNDTLCDAWLAPAPAPDSADSAGLLPEPGVD